MMTLKSNPNANRHHKLGQYQRAKTQPISYLTRFVYPHKIKENYARSQNGSIDRECFFHQKIYSPLTYRTEL